MAAGAIWAMQLSSSRSRTNEIWCSNCRTYGHSITQCIPSPNDLATAIGRLESQTDRKENMPLLVVLICCGTPLFIGFCWTAFAPDGGGGILLAIVAGISLNALLKLKDQDLSTDEELLLQHKGRFALSMFMVFLMYIDFYIIHYLAMNNRQFIIIPAIIECLLFITLVILHQPLRKMSGWANVILTAVSLASFLIFPFVLISRPVYAIPKAQSDIEWEALKFVWLGCGLLFLYFSLTLCNENGECGQGEIESRRPYRYVEPRHGRREVSSWTAPPAAEATRLQAAAAASRPVVNSAKTCQTTYSLRPTNHAPSTAVAPRNSRPSIPTRTLSVDSFHSCASRVGGNEPEGNSLLWPD